MSWTKVVSGNCGMAQAGIEGIVSLFCLGLQMYVAISESGKEMGVSEGDSPRERLEVNHHRVPGKVAPIRILLVDDHEIARRSIRSILSRQAGVDVVCETANGEEAVKKAEELHPTIILLDITLPGISGIQAARQIRAVSPSSRIIFVSQHDSVQTAKDALSAGAHGYVVKSDAGRDLLMAIGTVHEGRTFVSRTLIARGWA